MKSWQDFQASAKRSGGKGRSCLEAVKEAAASEIYRTAKDAEAYYRHENPTIARTQRMIYTMLGEAMPDIWRPNHKIPSRYYHYFITQEVQYLLGNGVSFPGTEAREKLGRGFDRQVQKAAVYALNAGVSFGFWNADRLEVFPLCGVDEPSFCPLWDEEDGSLRAGIRFWRLGEGRPLRMTLFEAEGTTDFILPKEEGAGPCEGEVRAMGPRKPYSGGGSPGGRLPIVPFFNTNRQSELTGARAALDAYDLLLSGLVNNTDEGNLVYWVLKNCNAMDEEDDAAFLAGLRRTRVVHADGDEGASVEAHTVEVPVDASEAALTRLRSQLFDDFMALDVKNIAGGTPTATQIAAAYEPLNAKTDAFEYCALEFLEGILSLAGVKDPPSFRRSVIANAGEQIANILAAAPYLDGETVTEQLCVALGLTDRAGEILEKVRSEERGVRSGGMRNEE